MLLLLQRKSLKIQLKHVCFGNFTFLLTFSCYLKIDSIDLFFFFSPPLKATFIVILVTSRFILYFFDIYFTFSNLNHLFVIFFLTLKTNHETLEASTSSSTSPSSSSSSSSGAKFGQMSTLINSTYTNDLLPDYSRKYHSSDNDHFHTQSHSSSKEKNSFNDDLNDSPASETNFSLLNSLYQVSIEQVFF